MKPSEQIRLCEAGERADVLALVGTCGLPADGLADHWDTTWVAVDPAEPSVVLGSVALEIYGSAALLRSLAILESRRSRGLGHALYEFAMARAADLGVEKAIILTTTAESFFARRGFVVIAREAVPQGLRASAEFRGACPSSATVMVRSVR
jgi:N-acetylglutamate synthase-like GNAT family acetyltransferase